MIKFSTIKRVAYVIALMTIANLVVDHSPLWLVYSFAGFGLYVVIHAILKLIIERHSPSIQDDDHIRWLENISTQPNKLFARRILDELRRRGSVR